MSAVLWGSCCRTHRHHLQGLSALREKPFVLVKKSQTLVRLFWRVFFPFCSGACDTGPEALGSRGAALSQRGAGLAQRVPRAAAPGRRAAPAAPGGTGRGFSRFCPQRERNALISRGNPVQVGWVICTETNILKSERTIRLEPPG